MITKLLPNPHHNMRHHLHHSHSLPLNLKMGLPPLKMSIQTKSLKNIYSHQCHQLHYQMQHFRNQPRLKIFPTLLTWVFSISFFPKNSILQSCLTPLLPKWMLMEVIVLVALTTLTTFKNWKMILTTSSPYSCLPGYFNLYLWTHLNHAPASTREACMLINKTGLTWVILEV